jgi:uncharacterized membrane protein YczE
VKGAFDRPVQRSARLLSGLVLFGLALAILVQAHLGLDPWNVFASGVARHTGLTLGTIIVISSLLVLLIWIPLKQRPGLGTIANSLIVGPVLDLGLAVLPRPELLGWRIAYLGVSIVLLAVATGLYLGAGWGPGPRDGLMTGLARLGMPVFAARAAVELTVLGVGWLLGGSVGVGTVVFALAIGPLVDRAIPVLRMSMPAARTDATAARSSG